MAVPSSGQLRLRADINQEVNGNDTDDNVSLGTLSNDSGFTDPDNMSEFYGYSACSIVNTGHNEINIMNASSSSSIFVRLRYTEVGLATACQPTSWGVYLGTSSTYTNNTKYTLGSGTAGSWGPYQTKDYTITGLSSNTTYYARQWATNVAGESVQTYNSSATTPLPTVPVSYGQHLVNSGDWSNNMYCPIGNFVGGFYFHFNCGVTCELYVYGGQSFTGNTGSLGGVCQNRAGWYGANQWRYNLVNFSSPCGISGSTGTNYTGYGAVAAPNYVNSTRSTTKTCY